MLTTGAVCVPDQLWRETCPAMDKIRVRAWLDGNSAAEKPKWDADLKRLEGLGRGERPQADKELN